ncbi:hypothetical protein Ciccas_005257 [Cichlidogyrus casuarinus]|uniref:Uncharacterized protein n=1 Tax=Cichlidogyrus casuarinus TaxID=1844966 RepID=A0ABD2Q973_9PLAT
MTLFRNHANSDSRINFKRFLHYYEGLSIAVGGCPLDTGNLEDPDTLDCWNAEVTPPNEALLSRDPFVQIVKTSWGLTF